MRNSRGLAFSVNFLADLVQSILFIIYIALRGKLKTGVSYMIQGNTKRYILF